MNIIIRFFRTQAAKKHAKELRNHFKAVLNMRRDILKEEDLKLFNNTIFSLKEACKHGKKLEEVLCVNKSAEEIAVRLTPPQKFRQFKELVETLVVAFGVAMAFRAYFFQPYKIPTGSMQPTLYGMHSEAYTPQGTRLEPNFMDRQLLKHIKWCITGKWFRDVTAPNGGTVTVVEGSPYGAPGYVLVLINGKKYKIPRDAYERGDGKFGDGIRAGLADMAMAKNAPYLMQWTARPGDRIWSGYVINGDQVFVNRMKWNFRHPNRGEIMVFATDGIKDLQPGEFYIKRMVGLPGNVIGVDEPYLLNRGERITYPDSILRIAEKRPAWDGGPSYYGYTFAPGGAFRSVPRGNIIVKCPLASYGDEIPLASDQYLAMGDNTQNSFDGRYWGPVPRRRLIGPASCIYWPLSIRWGFVD